MLLLPQYLQAGSQLTWLCGVVCVWLQLSHSLSLFDDMACSTAAASLQQCCTAQAAWQAGHGRDWGWIDPDPGLRVGVVLFQREMAGLGRGWC